MAVSDPTSVTIGGEAVSLSRIATGDTTGSFVSGDFTTRELFYPRVTKAGRRANVVQLRRRKVTTDPLVSTTNVEVEASVSITINAPATGFTASEILELLTGLYGQLTASNNALATKLINGES